MVPRIPSTVYTVLVCAMAAMIQAAIVVREASEVFSELNKKSALERRVDQNFLGGWSLRAMVCPAGQQKCKGTYGMPACCPEGTDCYSDYIRLNDYMVCCPSGGTSCVSTQYSLPVCADPSWVLWQPYDTAKQKPYGTPFCCLKGQKGYLTTGDRTNPACGVPEVAVPSGMSATTITPAGATAAPGGSDGSSDSKSTNTAAGAKPTSDASSGTGKDGKDGSSTSSSSSSSSAASSSSSSSLSGGTIGGIVGGAIAGIAILALLLWVVFRMGKRKAANNHPPVACHNTGFEQHSPTPPPSAMYQSTQYTGSTQQVLPGYAGEQYGVAPGYDAGYKNAAQVDSRDLHQLENTQVVSPQNTGPYSELSNDGRR